MNSSAINQILRSNNTVFTFNELALLLGITDAAKLATQIHYYVKKGALHAIRKGIYAKDKNYSVFELATKIYTPAYISFETVLAQQGVIFQAYQQIFVASYLSRDINCDHQHLTYKKIKSSVLTHSMGVTKQDYFFIADKERAFLDTLYLNKDYYFDNLHSMDWKKCFEMVLLYQNKSLQKRLKQLFDQEK